MVMSMSPNGGDMKLKDLGDRYNGHVWLSKYYKHTMVLDPIDDVIYYMICPVCGDNRDLRHYNWYSSKMLDEPLRIECQRCGEVTLKENMELEILKSKE